MEEHALCYRGMVLLILSAAWARQVIVEVDRGPITMAPMVQLRAGPDSVELPCSDDGQLPDRQGDDGVATCAGEGPDAAVYQVEVRAGSTDSWIVEVGDADPVQIRVDEEGARLSSWVVEATKRPEEPARKEQPQPPQQEQQPPQQEQPQVDGGSLAWAVLAAVIALQAGLVVGRGRRKLPSGVSWPPPTMREVEELPPLQGAVLSVGPEAVGLRLQSDDVLDVLDALSGLRAREPALPLTLVLSTPLRSPGEVGRTAQERLLTEAPAGTTILVLRGAR